MTSFSQLDRIIEAWEAALPRLAISGAGADGTEHRARVALALLRRWRENARLGTAWKDGDFFCAQPDGRCEESASWLFSPVCEHEPEPEVDAEARQFAALLLISPEDHDA